MGHPLTWIPIVRGEGMLHICWWGSPPLKRESILMSTVNFPNPQSIKALKKKKYNSKWEPDVFSDNGIRLRLFVDLASVADREILIVV